MAKNDFARRLMTAQRNKTWLAVAQSQDMACIALSEEFGFGPERQKRFCAKFREIWNEMAQLTVEDGKADRKIEYSVQRFEERLQKACGKYYVPREARYER